jgi:hypothetical protein
MKLTDAGKPSSRGNKQNFANDFVVFAHDSSTVCLSVSDKTKSTVAVERSAD